MTEEKLTYLINVHDRDDLEWKIKQSFEIGFKAGWKAAYEEIAPNVDKVAQHLDRLKESHEILGKILSEPFPETPNFPNPFPTIRNWFERFMDKISQMKDIR